jgi:polysaccharide pyruvyl transferase
MQLLPFSAFAKIFEPLRGRRIGYARTPGNVGDGLIEAAAFQMLRHFGIDFVVTSPSSSQKIDEWLLPGGGSMGSFYAINEERRKLVLADGHPVSVLPQSFMGPEAFGYARVFVRERASLELRPDACLAPDLALGLNIPWSWKLALGLDHGWKRKAALGEGLWLRKDEEAIFPQAGSLGDPAERCSTPFRYLRLAALHTHVITDRLHFAIAALLCGRKATLLPNSYHKNRSMYETWLRELGCEWRDAP